MFEWNSVLEQELREKWWGIVVRELNLAGVSRPGIFLKCVAALEIIFLLPLLFEIS